MTVQNMTPIGITNFRNEKKKFGIYDSDKMRHLYCIGKSGSGKSALLENMAISDIERGSGVCIIDVHGDLAEDILDHIPKGRIEDVIYFNPSDTEFPIAFNPLKGIHPTHHALVVSGIIATFKKQFHESWGPRMEYILRYSLFTLLDYRKGSLLDIQPLLTDKVFRERILMRCINPAVLSFWRNEYDKYTPAFRSEAISPILNKLGLFQTGVLRNITGQKTRSFNMLDVMDERKILIVNLSKGKIGEDASALLGSMVITSIQLAALYRAKQPEHLRRPFYLYVDEMHTFITQSFTDILSESRKFGLSLFLTHQYIDQLNDKIRAAIFGNVGTLISFRIGATDATYLAKEFSPVFNETDLISLPRYHIYLKLMIDGTASAPFSAVTMPLPLKPSESYKDCIIAFSQQRYGRKREDVEEIIAASMPQAFQPLQKELFD